MNIGICECEIGKHGAPCKYQFILWSNSFSNNSKFLLLCNQEQGKYLAELAIGRSLHDLKINHCDFLVNHCENEYLLRLLIMMLR